MPEQGLKFRPNKPAAFFLFCLILPLSLLSCRERAWGISREDILSRLESGNTAFLAKVSPEDAAQALRIGPEAPWYLARYARDAGNSALAAALLEIGARHSTGPFRILCIRDMALDRDSPRRLEAADLLAEPSPLFPSFSSDAPGLRVMILAEQGRFEEIPGGLVAFFARTPASPQLMDAGLTVAPGRHPRFDALFAFRRLIDSRAYGPAWEAAQELIDGEYPELFYRTMLSELGRAALYGATDPAAAIERLDLLAGRIDGGNTLPEEFAAESVPYMLSFYRGRISVRRGTSYSEDSRASFRDAITLAESPFDRDVALWYLLDLSGELPNRLMADLAEFAPGWDDPSFFSGILDRLIVRLVQNRNFTGLAELHTTLGPYLDRETRSRIAYITAKSGVLSPDEAESAYQTAFSEDHESLYYRMLASAELDALPSAPVLGTSHPAGNDAEEPAAAEVNPDRDSALEAVCRGFLRYSREADVYPFAREFFPDLSVPLAMELAGSLSAAGHHTDALRLMVLAVGAEPGPVTDEQLAGLYPRPWLKEVSSAAEKHGIPEYLLYALVRTESFFNASVVSHAGAVGLTQLMRPTAGDIARKLKVSEYDLSDPATNLEFGAFYLAELVRRLDGNVMAALFSYNAGISRVRSWFRAGSDLDPVLFLESLPFAETRGYGRKVLAASIVYGYLYYQKSPGDIIRELF